jgi:glycosyltransferase involved in cell wall biosynthesis
MVSEHADPLATLGDVDAGGQNVHVAELSAALVRAGHEVIVYTRRETDDQEPEVQAPAGYRVVHVPAGPARQLPKDDLLPHMDAFGDYLAEDWARRRPHLAHAHFWMSGLATLRGAAGYRVPTVQTYHALGVVKRRHLGSEDPSPPSRIELECRIGQRMDRIVATCSDEVFELIRLGVPRSKITIVPCGVDLDLFSPVGPVLERRLPHRIVTVGRLVPRKGFDTAIRAVSQVPDTELIIAGGPADGKFDHDPEAARLRRLADELGLADRVVLAGQVNHAEMPALLRSADAVLCTPAYEPFGIVPLEAMACGRPVVASAVGGLTDTVLDHTTGFLVPAGDPAAAADRIRQLISDPVRREAFGTAGLDRVRSRYSWDRIAADTLRAYRSLPDADPSITTSKGEACESSASTPSSTTRQRR